MKYNKTTLFFKRMIFKNKSYNDILVNIYIGWTKYPEEVGRCFYVLTKKEDNTLENIDNFVSKERELSFYVYKYKIPEHLLEDFIKPFLRGQYSKMNIDYVNQYIKHPQSNIMSRAHGIILKDKEIKREVELSIGMTLPEEAEIASKLDLNKEIIMNTSKITQCLDHFLKTKQLVQN